jgi:penicillin-binding protein 1C
MTSERAPHASIRRLFTGGVFAAAIFIGAAGIWLSFEAWRLGPLPLGRVAAQSVTVLDRNDVLLRAYTTPDGRWRLPLAPEEVDADYLAMLFAFEDARFHTHMGIDPRAVGRVVIEALRRGRLISGGSTLTMQTARLIEGTHERTGVGKIRQMIRAVQLERRFSKQDILALYLKLAPFGGNIEGVRAASLAYFGKEPRRLSLAEAALLVALPQSPEARRPDRAPGAAKVARDRVLRRAIETGAVRREEALAAMREAVPTLRREVPRLAAHLADAEVEADRLRLVHRLTIDAAVQRRLEILAGEHVKSLGRGLSAAVVVVENATGRVLAHVGSAGYLDETRSGAIDMARAVRSPGSTLKPVVYGLAFDAGIAHPETLIEDRPARFGSYSPRNFDQDFAGTITMREALAKSLNIPAVKILDAIGPTRLHTRLQGLGIDPVLPKGAEPSLAMALGGVGLRLVDLATLYGVLARGGEPVTLSHRRDAERAADGALKPGRLMSPAAAWYVADILRNAPAPAHAKAGQIAYKTGTSYGYRDAWSAGFDGRHTIAVWVGRADGASVPGLNGRQSAAPLLFDAFSQLSERRTPLPAPPVGVMRAANSELPATLRRFQDARDPAAAGPYREAPVAIAFPPDRSEIEADGGDGEGLSVRAEGGVLPLTWMLDGEPVQSDPLKREALLERPQRGFLRLTVIDAQGRTDRVTVRIK